MEAIRNIETIANEVENIELVDNYGKEHFTIIDFETTGLLNDPHLQAVEIGAIRIDDEGKEIGRLSLRVRLNVENLVPSAFETIKNISGIEEHEAHDGVLEPQALLALTVFIGNSTVVAHNAPFDLGILARANVYPSFFICTRALAKMVEPDKSPSLAAVYERFFGEPIPNHHRALSDCEATVRVFKKLVELAAARGIHRRDYQNVVIDGDPDRPLDFVPYQARPIKLEKIGK